MSYSMRTEISASKTCDELERSLELWHASDVDITFNVERRKRDSYNVSRAERAVTVAWTTSDGRPMSLAMDEHERACDNVRVLYLAIDSMRLNEKRGIDPGLMRSAYLQLDGPRPADPWAVLGINQNVVDYAVAREAYKKAARAAHPDLGGSNERMAAVNQAWIDVKTEKGWSD